MPASRLLRVVGAALRSSLRPQSVAHRSFLRPSLVTRLPTSRSPFTLYTFCNDKNPSTVACSQEATRSTVVARSQHAGYAVDRSSASTARARGRADKPRQQRRDGEKNHPSGVERTRDDRSSCSKHIGRGANADVIFLDGSTESTQPALEDSIPEPCSYEAITHTYPS